MERSSNLLVEWLRRNYIVLREHWAGRGRSNGAVFDRLYELQRWGGADKGTPPSGLGSAAENSAAYEEFVVDYITKTGARTVLDIGCGDFSVSGRIMAALPKDMEYLGIDASKRMVLRNTELFARPGISFLHVDAAEDELPPADIVLVREVLQHLSNKAVSAILGKLGAYPDVLITNTVAHTPVSINMDIPTGAASRAHLGSGLWLDQPPFSLPVDELLRVSHRHTAADLVTVRLASGNHSDKVRDMPLP